MNMIHLLTGIRSPVLFRMLVRNGVSFGPNMIQLPMLLVNSLISSILTGVERIKYTQSIKRTVIEKSPVFIIGHWRSGTTYLHQLMHLDPQFTAPSVVQTVIPDHFLFSTKYYIPVMKLLMPKKRPMDEVMISPLDPQEDEFALIRLGSESPLEKIVFPAGNEYFLAGYDKYIPEGVRLKVWKQNLLNFYKKITWLTGKQIVSKNPFHTMRMPLLRSMFPGARFIHIRRHPFEVVPSTIKMWNTVAAHYSLKNGWKKPGIDEVSSVLRSFDDYVSHEKQLMGEHEYAEVRFENLEKDPVEELRKIYAELNLEFSGTFEREIKRFLESHKEYAKNIYHLTQKEKDVIGSILGGNVEQWNCGMMED